jgi:hypothetical protein
MNIDFKKKYTALAYQNANIEAANWQPQLGFMANEALLLKVYTYYQQLYLKAPDKFLWLGLARLTGGQVLWGMRRLCKLTKDPCAITQHIVHIAKDIFDELAWQHEMYLQDPLALIKYLHTIACTKTYKPAVIWHQVFTGNNSQIAIANMQQLHNEQLSTVQHHYEQIRQDAYSKKYLLLTRFVMRNIHPYHIRFIWAVPFKDVTQFKYRWQWIAAPKGMWATWVAISQAERTRLVSLNNEAVIAHKWM